MLHTFHRAKTCGQTNLEKTIYT